MTVEYKPLPDAEIDAILAEEWPHQDFVFRLAAEVRASRARAATTIAALTELGLCWRGDWNDFDGRQLRSQLEDVAPLLNGTMTLESARVIWGMCPHGRGHWPKHCDADCEPEGGLPG